MNVEKLKKLFESSKDKYSDSKEIGTTYQTMYNIIYKGSVCKVDLMERIANFYQVPVGYFLMKKKLLQILCLAKGFCLSLKANNVP